MPTRRVKYSRGKVHTAAAGATRSDNITRTLNRITAKGPFPAPQPLPFSRESEANKRAVPLWTCDEVKDQNGHFRFLTFSYKMYPEGDINDKLTGVTLPEVKIVAKVTACPTPIYIEELQR